MLSLLMLDIVYIYMNIVLDVSGYAYWRTRLQA